MKTLQCPIKPNNINADVSHFFDTFGNMETEASAVWLVRLAQHRKGWESFTFDDINAYCAEHGPGDGFTFNQLLDRKMILRDGDLYHFTEAFVGKCYAASPVARNSNDD